MHVCYTALNGLFLENWETMIQTIIPHSETPWTYRQNALFMDDNSEDLKGTLNPR